MENEEDEEEHLMGAGRGVREDFQDTRSELQAGGTACAKARRHCLQDQLSTQLLPPSGYHPVNPGPIWPLI